MKYKNVEIGDKPTKEQFQEYVSKAGFLIDVDYWYDKYDKRNWLTIFATRKPIHLGAR